MRSQFIIVASFVALAACQTPSGSGEDSPFYAIPVGSRLVLNSPLTIPADRAAVYIQRGKIVPQYLGRETYYANCRLEVNTVKSAVQTIEPDTFVIYDVGQKIRVNRLFRPGLRLAGMGSDNGDITTKLYERILYLHSDKQPDVRSMDCGRWDDDPGLATHLSIDEIRNALGQLFTLQLSNRG